MEQTTIPPISLPFPARRHPDAEAIEEKCHDWALRFDLVRSERAAQALAASRFGEFAAYAYPTAPLLEAELAAEWFTFQFMADDQYEEGAHGTPEGWAGIAHGVRGALECGPIGPLLDTPLIRALADLSRRLDVLASSAWKQRFTAHFMDTMHAVFREMELRDRGIPPGFEEFVGLRRDAGSVFPCLDVVEVCMQAELAPEVYLSAPYQELFVSATDIVIWTNDLYSLDKEVACGIVTNVVLVLERQRGLDRQQALSATHAMIDERVSSLVAAERRLPQFARATGLDKSARQNLYRCGAGVLDFVAGSNHWHANTSRYQQLPGGVAADAVEDLFRVRICDDGLPTAGHRAASASDLNRTAHGVTSNAGKKPR